MKKFLKHIILYSLLLMVATAAILTYSVTQLNKDRYFLLKPAASNVFLGYSHVQFSIADSILPSSRNLGMKGEAYVFTLIKARKIFQNNPSIKNAFIEVSNKQFNVYMDSCIWQDQFLKPRIPRFLSVMNAEEFSLLFSKNKSGTISGMTDFPRQNFVALSRNGDDVMRRMEWGGYRSLAGNKLPDDLKRIRALGYDPDTLDNQLSLTNILYLQKLVQLCREHSIKVWFFRTPMHPKSGDRTNEIVFQQILKSKFADIPFFDFIDLDLPDDEYFDINHLNQKGAKRFSGFLGDFFTYDLWNYSGNKLEMIHDRWHAFSWKY
ncbi:hypothetical protein HHL16_12630 [Pseudoflavitalea sp. G-6-1-2]|uniref:SGNH/GDSL hydrolase family protein n=1 Tax=Pseudoflavitalea sp. G-6-1-2 TaxID=2728841 RepID=UPI00146DB591|nr:SGNH/GDSL hydrolase family protein [Pseudoflavitalea sp. G-6-1-2]NML21728.1 hypothetical protein [Pseudoflavitalea sp. G-6-1-2]